MVAAADAGTYAAAEWRHLESYRSFLQFGRPGGGTHTGDCGGDYLFVWLKLGAGLKSWTAVCRIIYNRPGRFRLNCHLLAREPDHSQGFKG